MTETESSQQPTAFQVMDHLMVQYKCDMCLEIYIDATITNCSHVFCRFCINKWLQFSPKCPQCHCPITSCKSAQNVDEEVTCLFQELPAAVRNDREDLKQRRRKLEAEHSPMNNTNASYYVGNNAALLQKLRSQREKGLVRDEDWVDKLTASIKVEGKEQEKLQLPRLVPYSSEKNEGESNKGLGGTSQYENLKLPPIKIPKGPHLRQPRGVMTTTSSTCTLKEDTFPVGMEGDLLQMDSSATAEDNIRELERRNQILETQLFGAYDRILDAIKENDKTMTNSVDPKVFNCAEKLKQSGYGKQEPQFSKESMLVREEKESQHEQDSRNDVEELLAETEDLIEIEDFLKKYPFERIRDDDSLINFDNIHEENENSGDDMDLDLLDPDSLKDIAKHRAARCNKPLSADQQAIEDFYKKLELKYQKQTGGSSNSSQPNQFRVPKSLTQQTSSSRLKRMPLLKMYDSNNSNLQLPQGSTVSSVAKQQDKNKNAPKKLTTTMLKPLSEKSSPGAGIVKQQLLLNKLSPADFKSPPRQRNDNDDKKHALPNTVKACGCGGGTGASANIGSSEQTQDFNLTYDDFLKLEIDFLDGDGDWKDFEKPPPRSLSSSKPGAKRSGAHAKQLPQRNQLELTKRLESMLKTPGKDGLTNSKINSMKSKNNTVGIPSKRAKEMLIKPRKSGVEET